MTQKSHYWVYTLNILKNIIIKSMFSDHHSEFYQTFKNSNCTIYPQSLSKSRKRRNILNSFYEACITLTLKSGKDITERKTENQYLLQA